MPWGMGGTVRSRPAEYVARQRALLHDDRLGRCLTRLFAGTGPELILAVVRHVLQEFHVGLDEVHNDSTTVSFYGAYSEAAEEGRRLGRATHAITFGHNKDHRPDLKQLLYILTVSHDGGVPLYFTRASGNVVDDQTHQATWDLLCQLVGGPDFLYVADCKLASAENLAYIAKRHGRFVTVLPRTHGEDEQFRTQLRNRSERDPLAPPVRRDGRRRAGARSLVRVCRRTAQFRRLSAALVPQHPQAELDQVARSRRVQRAWVALGDLRTRLQGPRTRFRERTKVQQAVDAILTECQVTDGVRVQIEEQEQATYKQAQPGRPSAQTKYKKRNADALSADVGTGPRRARRGRARRRRLSALEQRPPAHGRGSPAGVQTATAHREAVLAIPDGLRVAPCT